MPDNLDETPEQSPQQARTTEEQQLKQSQDQGGLHQTTSQSGKFNTNIGEATNVYFGDIGISPEDLAKLIPVIQAVLTPKPNLQNSIETTENEYLEKLALDVRPVEPINSRLQAIEEINQVIQFSESQLQKFNTLKTRIKSLNDINQELEEVSKSAGQLLQQAINSLTAKLHELSTSSQKDCLAKAISQACLEQQVDELQQLQWELEQGKRVAQWLDQKRSNLAESIGRYALDAYPDIKNNSSPKRLKAFYLSVQQFLERLSHCLKWGRYNNLDAPSTPVVLDDKVYEMAFNRLKSILPTHLPEKGVEQLRGYIDYLTQNLATYRHLSSD